jgi:hypothetical protein
MSMLGEVVCCKAINRKNERCQNEVTGFVGIDYTWYCRAHDPRVIRCRAINTRKQKCRLACETGSQYCWQHISSGRKEEKISEERQKGASSFESTTLEEIRKEVRKKLSDRTSAAIEKLEAKARNGPGKAPMTGRTSAANGDQAMKAQILDEIIDTLKAVKLA